MPCTPRTTPLLLALAVLLLGTPSSQAATFVVDSIVDEVDTDPGNGACRAASGACTLRAAVQESNALAGGDTAILPSGIYTLSIPGTGEDAAATGDLDITDTLTILGESRESTIVDGNQLDDVFTVEAATTMIDLTIQNAAGAGIADGEPLTIARSTVRNNSDAGVGGVDCGAAFGRCFGPLTMVDSIVTGNGGDGIGDRFATVHVTLLRSEVAGNGGSGIGWGVYLDGRIRIEDSVVARNLRGVFLRGEQGSELRVIRSTINDNTLGGILYGSVGGGLKVIVENSMIAGNGGLGGISAPSAGAAIVITGSTIANNTSTGDGGGIAAHQFLTIRNSTITNNHADGHGGGIFVLNPQVGTIANTTIASNVADADGDGFGDGGGLYATPAFEPFLDPPSGSVVNSILADNHDVGGEGPDCAIELRSGGHNLITTTAGCNVIDDPTSNLVGIAPLLGPLADNGGLTPTRALLAGSPAIDTGSSAACEATDQRSVVRPQGVTCDIGAYEFACGNHAVDPGETCDDGNSLGDDCCTADCHLETDGSSCSDGDACTTGDACSSGSCLAGTPVDCGVCESCDAARGCVAHVLSGCHQPTQRLSGQLVIANQTTPKLTWQWSKGQSTALADFGEPLGGDEYALCLFEESGPTAQVAFRAMTRAGTCGRKPCWKPVGASGFQYKNRAQTPDGLDSVVLKSGSDRKAKVLAIGKGDNLTLPQLPLSLPARIQLQAPNGQCWEARYSELGTSRNTKTQFKAKAFYP